IAIAFALVICVVSAASALAKQVCVEDDQGNAWVFKNVPALKKAGKIAPLHGLFVTPIGQPGTITGTAVVLADGDVAVGVTILFPGIDSIVELSFLGELEKDFEGTVLQGNSFPPILR